MKVEIYSDVVCPWCRIGERRFARAFAAYEGAADVDVVFRAFQLDPSASHEAEPIMDRLERKYGPDASAMLEHASKAAREEGLEMNWDGAKSVNTLRAHRLMRWALERSGAATQRAVAEALFAAHFERGADIGDPGVLAGLAASVALDRAEAEAHLRSDDGLEETRAEIEQALRMGIRSVPTFVFEGRWAVQGAQSTDTFAQVLKQVDEESTGS